jgi:hypothetical protein
VEDLGLRPYVVEILTVSWPGERGLGVATEASRVLIQPAPVVSDPTPRMVSAAPGKFERGDRVISKVSRTYTAADFPDSAGATEERYFLLNGDPYRMVSEPEIRNFEWRLHVRRMRKRPAVA